MTARTPLQPPPHDSKLDRMLAFASTPQVPHDLAARILRDVTSLPQQASAPVAARTAEAAGSPARPWPRHWLRAAGFAAVVLISGTTLAMLTLGGADDEQIGEQIAVVDRTASPPPQAVPSVRPAAAKLTAATPAAGQSGTSVVHAPDHTRQPVAAAGKPVVNLAQKPAVNELASEAPVKRSATENPEGLAENGPIDPASNVGPLAPTASTYGPPAGFGIYGNSGMPMPEGSSGPVSASRGGRPGGGPGGPGGPMHPY